MSYRKCGIWSVSFLLLCVLVLTSMSYADVIPVANLTPQVRDAIVAAGAGCGFCRRCDCLYLDITIPAGAPSHTAVPKSTLLLANYPNPFNPETWIPYQLSKSTDVTLTIYDIKGSVVRTLDLGHQRAGVYQTRIRAAYWDGRNAVGEKVASGLYFYTLTAGEFTASRKMLIMK